MPAIRFNAALALHVALHVVLHVASWLKGFRAGPLGKAKRSSEAQIEKGGPKSLLKDMSFLSVCVCSCTTVDDIFTQQNV